MLLPQIIKLRRSYRAQQDVTFIVLLVIPSDTQPEDLERPQTPGTNARVILVANYFVFTVMYPITYSI